MKVEREIKFYFPISKLDNIKNSLRIFKYIHTKHELILNYNNPNPNLSFYDKKIDGRLRLRIMRYLDTLKKGEKSGLLSWKQRIPDYALSKIRHEYEIECYIAEKDVENLKIILADILKCPLVSSYERERSYYYADGLEITLDKFPFGLMLEIEFKNKIKKKNELLYMLKKINLDIKDASILSCDDMYKYLCRKQNKQIKSHILFNDMDMPILN